MNLETIQLGVFRARLLATELGNLREQGIYVDTSLDREPVAKVLEQDFSPKIREQAARMQAVYVAFFCMENAARDLIGKRLLERHGAGWWKKVVPQKIRDHVEKLRKKEENNRYLQPRAGSDVGYTFFAHLAQVIVANWEDFKDLFPDQHWVNSRFNDLEQCRNVIMHTNVLPLEEIYRVDQIMRDWLRQVG